jgi:hypothetical protein
VRDNGLKNYTILNDTDSLKNTFQYFMDEDNITTYLQPDMNLTLSFYDMKSLTPSIVQDFKFENSSIKNLLKGTEK